MSDSALACGYSGGPPMNTDISGIGVRISFYLQTLFVELQAARSNSSDDFSGAQCALIATNVAMTITALVLGLLDKPEISFHDALVVLYLLTLCWAPNIVLLPTSSRLNTGGHVTISIIQMLSVIQSLFVFAFALVLLRTAPYFGSNPECNNNAVLVLFRPFKVFDNGRIAGWVICGAFLGLYMFMITRDYLYPLYDSIRKQIAATDNPKGDEAPPLPTEPAQIPKDFSRQYNSDAEPDPFLDYNVDQPESRPNINWFLIIQLVAIVILWALAVMNTELLIVWNHFEQPDNPPSQWQFGQVLPMLLIFIPFVTMIKAFKAHGLRKEVNEGMGMGSKKEV